MDIYDVTQSVELITNTSNDGNQVLTHSEITHNTPLTHTWRIDADNTQSDNFIRNYSKRWDWAVYYGESAIAINLTAAEILLLRAKLLTSSYNRMYSMLAGATYKFITYPSSFGEATSFIDSSTGFSLAMNPFYIVSITNIHGQTTNYNVHRSTNILNGSVNIVVN